MKLKFAIDVQKSIGRMNNNDITCIVIFCDKTILVKFKNKNNHTIPIRSLARNGNLFAIVKDMIYQQICIIENNDKQVKIHLWNGSKIIFKVRSNQHPSFFLNF